MTGKDQQLLIDLSIGEQAKLLGFTVENVATQRLLEMGLTPDEYIEIIRFAPMGDPIEIRVKGYLLSLRRHEAELIQVKKI